MTYIGEIKNISPVEITQDENGWYLISSIPTKWKRHLSPSEYELISSLFDVHEIQVPLKKNTLRNKMVCAYPILNQAHFRFWAKLEGKALRPERSFLHIHGTFNGLEWNRMTTLMESMYGKGYINYLLINGRIVEFTNNSVFEKNYEHNRHHIDNDRRISINFGVKSLKFFKHLTLNGFDCKIYQVDGDYTYYENSNVVMTTTHTEIDA